MVLNIALFATFHIEVSSNKLSTLFRIFAIQILFCFIQNTSIYLAFEFLIISLFLQLFGTRVRSNHHGIKLFPSSNGSSWITKSNLCMRQHINETATEVYMYVVGFRCIEAKKTENGRRSKHAHAYSLDLANNY